MGSLLLKWVASNKLLTVALVVIVALSTWLVVCKLENAMLRLDNANQKAALVELESLGKIQKQRIEESQRQIAEQKKRYSQVREKIRIVEVPQECPEAVTWGSEQINAIMDGVK